MAESLYGTKNPSKTKHKPISSSTSLAFSSTLSSLISSSSYSTRSRPAKSSSKSDIFTTHNKNVKKRSAADMSEDQQQPQTKHDIGTVSASELQRSKRKMEEKVRLYNAMKRGEYIGSSTYNSHDGLVDFDRKWADSQLRGSRDSASEHSSDDNSDSEINAGPNHSDRKNAESETKSVEYTDEFGRLLHLTPSQLLHHQRRDRLAAAAAQETAELSAHPERPSNIIYGDTIQHSAFNPDRNLAEKMAELAKKRDKEPTPPPEVHYDANWEVRTRGTGFYAFSQDGEGRRREMEGLQRERQGTETERRRREKETGRDMETREGEGGQNTTKEKKGEAEVKDAMDLMAEERALRDTERMEMKEREETKKNLYQGRMKKEVGRGSESLVPDEKNGRGNEDADREAVRFLESLDIPPSQT